MKTLVADGGGGGGWLKGKKRERERCRDSCREEREGDNMCVESLRAFNHCSTTYQRWG